MGAGSGNSPWLSRYWCAEVGHDMHRSDNGVDWKQLDYDATYDMMDMKMDMDDFGAVKIILGKNMNFRRRIYTRRQDTKMNRNNCSIALVRVRNCQT